MDGNYARHQVIQPFQIVAFRSLYEHHWDKNHFFLGEAHNFWEFTCVLEGEAESVNGTKVFHLRPGNLLCFPPMVFHSSRSLGSNCYNLNFAFEITGTMPAVISEGIFHLSPIEINELTAIFGRLCQAYMRETVDADLGAEATNALTSFIIRLSRQHKPHNKFSKSHSSMLYQKIVESMQEMLYENISIQELATRNGVSTTTIKDLFRTYAGMGPKKYYSDMRGIEVLRLLEEGIEIQQITEMLNYSSPSYFSNSFKKQFGMPPGQFRKKQLQSIER